MRHQCNHSHLFSYLSFSFTEKDLAGVRHKLETVDREYKEGKFVVDGKIPEGKRRALFLFFLPALSFLYLLTDFPLPLSVFLMYTI